MSSALPFIKLCVFGKMYQGCSSRHNTLALPYEEDYWPAILMAGSIKAVCSFQHITVYQPMSVHGNVWLEQPTLRKVFRIQVSGFRLKTSKSVACMREMQCYRRNQWELP
ncbi:hypothetical protein GDO86_010428 [Hymenochirus boettgeri]|uniref:Uncharacterized protein n=1 Tax=Hymenochirus boettgeri TaxID=247094 RepID=A0A8T2JSZ7_9PIPI|nr:hypothetical protein GDO86_010428 [Hymenochirus boettgeri]